MSVLIFIRLFFPGGRRVQPSRFHSPKPRTFIERTYPLHGCSFQHHSNQIPITNQCLTTQLFLTPTKLNSINIFHSSHKIATKNLDLPRHMKRTLVLAILTSAAWSASQAQLSITTFSSPVNISFSGFTAPATWATATPGAGQLDSNIWAINSEVPRTTTAASFGGDITGGGGTSTGGVTSGLVYAFDVGGGVTALGVQPTGTFWTPGMFTLRLQNNTGSTITQLDVDWTVWVYNDQARSNDMRFYYSDDNVTYTHAGASVEVQSPGTADPSPTWQATNRTFSISSLSIADGSFYYLRWGGDDVSGSGARDEFGLSGIAITAIPEPSTYALLALGLGTLIFLRRRKTKARA